MLLRRIELWIRLLNAPILRWASLWLVRIVLAHQSERLERSWWRLTRYLILRPGSCCPEGGAQDCFASRYVGMLERSGALRLLARWLRTEDPARSSIRVEAFARVSVLAMLRHSILAMTRRLFGVPATVLLEAQLAPYPSCNLACAGCYSREEQEGPEPTREWLAYLVDEAAACGASAIQVVGKGEPFLAEERGQVLLDVIEARPHILFIVFTNGTSIAPGLASRMALLGNLLVLVSVDGPREVHEARRGAGTFDCVIEGLRLMQDRRVLFGYVSTVTEQSFHAVASPGFVGQMVEAGCVMGIYTRYFPLTPHDWESLRLSSAALAAYGAGLEAVRQSFAIPLLDIDEMEGTAGCRARAGVTAYIDGLTGAVAPCVKMPFSPPDCRIGDGAAAGLPTVLAHPFFARYRERGAIRRTGCSGDLPGELRCLSEELAQFGASSERLSAFQQRTNGVIP